MHARGLGREQWTLARHDWARVRPVEHAQAGDRGVGERSSDDHQNDHLHKVAATVLGRQRVSHRFIVPTVVYQVKGVSPSGLRFRMRRAMLGAAVLSGLLVSCSDSAPPAGIVHHEAQVTDAPETSTTLEVPSTTAPPVTEPAPAPEPAYQSPPVTSGGPRPSSAVPAPSEGRCGGSLPPCSVMQRESGGDPQAVNETGCGGRGCYGKWQIDPDTAESVGYPRRLDLQPEAVQDAAARAILARDGCQAWSTC